jgi:hypothetical protein
MDDSIDLIYRGYQLVAGMRNGRPVTYIHRGHAQLERFVGPSVIDCANRAKLRIDQMARQPAAADGPRPA